MAGHARDGIGGQLAGIGVRQVGKGEEPVRKSTAAVGWLRAQSWYWLLSRDILLSGMVLLS